MPGIYHGEDYDLAGFCVGVVEKDAIIDGSKVRAGDTVIGLASSGPHSNGIRSSASSWHSPARATTPSSTASRSSIGCSPRPASSQAAPGALARQLEVHGLAHITGGGLTDNIPRVLPDGLEAVLERRRWHRDPVFDWLQQTGASSRLRCIALSTAASA